MNAFIRGSILTGIIVFNVSFLHADDAAVPRSGFAASRYESLWTKSPFAVASPDAAPESTDYSLVGISQFDGVSYINLIDKQTQEHFLLTSEMPVRGLTFSSITHGATPAETSVLIKRNGEILTLKMEQNAALAMSPVNAPPQPGGMNPMIAMPGNGGANPSIQIPMPGVGGSYNPGGAGGRPPVRFRHPRISVPPYPGGAQPVQVAPGTQPQAAPVPQQPQPQQ